jgi:hypothetical protein
MKQNYGRFLIFGATLLAAAALAGEASATPCASTDTTCTFSLTQDFATGGPRGPGPYGAVKVTTISPTSVSVDLTLAAGEIFAVSGAGEALLFDIAANPAITVSGLTTGFTAHVATGQSIHADGTGNWQYSIECTGCGNGTGAPRLSGPLDFVITLASGIKPSSFISNGSVFFATDIGVPDAHGNFGDNSTGDVGAPSSSGGIPTPEPTSLVLVGSGLLGLSVIRRRTTHRNRK